MSRGAGSRYSPGEAGLRGVWLLDLETVPDDAARGQRVTVPQWWRDAHDFLAPPKKQVPSHWRDPKKIGPRQREIDAEHPQIVAEARAQHDAEVEDAYRRRALDPWTAQIVSVALAPAESPEDVETIDRADTAKDPGERMLLRRLDRLMRDRGVRGLLCWGGFDPPVLRARSAPIAPDVPALRAVLSVRSNGGRAWLARCTDPSEMTVRRLMGRREGWGLKPYAAALGLGAAEASVQSDAVLDAWVSGDAHGCAERAAEDVRLMAAVCSRESLWTELGAWWARAGRP